jgi:peroxiredoxin
LVDERAFSQLGRKQNCNKIILVVTFLVVGFFSACKKESPTSPAPPTSRSPTSPSQVYPGGTKVGETAADFSATDQNGNTVTLYQYSGKVILINLTANGCADCRIEAGYLEALFQKYKDKGFQIITLLLDYSPAGWASRYKFTFPVLDDSSYNIWNAYGEGWIPLNIVLDRSMTIRYKEAGYDEPSIVSQIEKYL